MLCKKSKDHALTIINCEKKEMIPLSEEENKPYEEQEACHLCKIKFCLDDSDEIDENDGTDENDEKFKKYQKVKDDCHYTGNAHSICNLKYKVPKNIPIIIHNAGYDTHFIINQLAEEFKGKLDCIGEHMEKFITFLVRI